MNSSETLSHPHPAYVRFVTKLTSALFVNFIYLKIFTRNILSKIFSEHRRANQTTNRKVGFLVA